MIRLIARVTARFSGRVNEDEAGQGLAEYALILALVAAVCLAALTSLGQTIASSGGFTALPAAL